MRQAIRFLLGDELRELAGFDPRLTVLDYIRLHEHRMGTKEGCNEGDCGACTVVLGEADGERMRYRAVNACIMLVGALDGRQLLTVEDLKGEDGTLHPVQRAMVEAHGSQCGFCTPGFVMSLFALSHEGSGAPGRDEIDDALAGNLCRCTGYGPIIAAAQAMGGEADAFDGRAAETAARLGALADGEDILIEGPDGGRFYAPADADALAALLEKEPGARLVAGTTDVGLWITKKLDRPDPLVYLGRAADLKGIVETNGHIEIGGAATYAEAAPLLGRHFPAFGEVLRRLGSAQVRNLGTVGGNIANGSPIGDTPPPLIALGARIVLRKGDARRALPLEEFFIDYGKQDLAPGEFLEKILVPLPAAGDVLHCAKISKRFDQDISSLLGAFNLRIVGGRVEAARIAFGGMAATPKRAPAAEAALVGQTWSEANVARAQAALEQDFQPIDDFRASAQYRMRVAKNLLMKAWLESSGEAGGAHLAQRREGQEAAHG